MNNLCAMQFIQIHNIAQLRNIAADRDLRQFAARSFYMNESGKCTWKCKPQTFHFLVSVCFAFVDCICCAETTTVTVKRTPCTLSYVCVSARARAQSSNAHSTQTPNIIIKYCIYSVFVKHKNCMYLDTQHTKQRAIVRICSIKICDAPAIPSDRFFCPSSFSISSSLYNFFFLHIFYVFLYTSFNELRQRENG